MTTPGIHLNLSSEDYHAGPGVSKSGLWTIAKSTPAHYKFGERKDTAAFDLGTAAHIAVLEPERLGAAVMCGPEDRRGNKWKDAQLQADHHGALLLPEGEYLKVLRIRDSADRSATLRDLRKGAMIEASGYAVDPETGALCRCRPDAYNPALNVILDLKTAQAGGREEFSRATANYGYHVQEAFYTDVWAQAHTEQAVTTQPPDAFIFVVIEKSAPFIVSCYELKPAAVYEGRAVYRRALATYAQCMGREALDMPLVHAWPGYPDDPEPLDIPRWAYRHTVPEEN